MPLTDEYRDENFQQNFFRTKINASFWQSNRGAEYKIKRGQNEIGSLYRAWDRQ
jgi:hypothetical protein